jgi:hypothetical protein
VTFLGIVLVQLLQRTTSAAPRYFYPCGVSAFFLAMAVLGERYRDQRARASRRPVLAGFLVVGALANAGLQAVGFLNEHVSSAEHEGVLVAPLLGLKAPTPAEGGWSISSDPWRSLFKYVDPDLAKGKRLLIDTESSPQGPLFTRQSRQLIIPEDRDFEQILAAAEGRVDYVAVDSRGARADSRFLASVLAVVTGGTNGTWTIDQKFDTITLYKYTARQ